MAEAQEPIGTEFHFIKPLRPSDPARPGRHGNNVACVMSRTTILVTFQKYRWKCSDTAGAFRFQCGLFHFDVGLENTDRLFFWWSKKGQKKTVFSLAESDICRHLNPDGKHLHHQQILAPQNDDSSCFAHWVQIVRVDLWQRPRFFETHTIICEFVPGCHPPFLRNPDLQTTWSSKTWWKWGMFFLERHVLLILVLDVMGRPCCVKRFFQTSWDVPLKPTVRWEPRRFVGWF